MADGRDGGGCELRNPEKNSDGRKKGKKGKERDMKSEPGTYSNSDEKKQSKKAKKNPSTNPTVSIAVAGSIIDNAQSLELATLLAGQIARAATIFRVDEVVVFDNGDASENITEKLEAGENESGARFLVRILEYLETPQYLRRRLFPMHKSLKFVGLLPPLDAPHHLRKHEWCPFREGVTLAVDDVIHVDVGLSKNFLVDEKLKPGKRVTVAMGTNREIKSDCAREIVSPSSPREEMGLYWGYKVRYAPNLSSVLLSSPYEGS